MVTLQKAGGIAALVEALTYVVGFVVMATLLDPGNTEEWNQTQKLAFVLERKAFFQIWTSLIYVVFGVVLVVLAVALHDRLKTESAVFMNIATPFGLIWSGLVIASGMVANIGLETVAILYSQDVTQATTAWAAIVAVQEGLGGGVEIVGGLWVLMISAASVQSTAFARPLAYLGFVVGTAGILTFIPSLSALGAVFGLGQILWFAWIGADLLRRADA